MNTPLLNTVNFPSDLRLLPEAKLPELAAELRQFIIAIVAVKEGHLGASLGVVELTIALHYVFNTPSDLLVWDVGHQAYGHKILTGRRERFYTNRQLGGLSGFPNRNESVYDSFGVGHAGTSISATLGMAIASQLQGDYKKQHIAVIGDASIAAGMAFEGLNQAGASKANLLVILNDNEMGIDPNVGALKNYLTEIKNGIPPQGKNLFEALNFSYFGPIDGHNIPLLLKTLRHLKSVNGPKLLHVITTKGKGLKNAEADQITYHAPGKFNSSTGVREINKELNQLPKYQDVFGLTLLELAKQNEKIIGITAAMPTGTSLKYMIKELPERAFDVGIAEQHAVTLAAGFATQGFRVFCAIYSTFLQRAYDQIIHDVALQNLPVVFCIDRAGLVGEDGSTHHGVFDLAYLRLIPNFIIFAPLNAIDLRHMLYTAQSDVNHPLAIRYPRGTSPNYDWKVPFKKLAIGKGICLKKGTDLAILSIGTIGLEVIKALSELDTNTQLRVAHYDMRFLKPLDVALLSTVFKSFKQIITIEDGVLAGGFGSAILEQAHHTNFNTLNITCLGIPDEFITHGTLAQLYCKTGIDFQSIAKKITEKLA